MVKGLIQVKKLGQMDIIYYFGIINWENCLGNMLLGVCLRVLVVEIMMQISMV